MKLEVGQTLYACGYRIKRVSFGYDLIIGLKVLKPKIKKLTKNFIVLDGQRISKKRLGDSVFLTEKELVRFMIEENKTRIAEKENSKRKQYMDIDHVEALKKDLKKWERFANQKGGAE